MEKEYDLTCKYELEWVVKAPWSKVVLREDELLHVIKCTICSAVGLKPCVMAPKWDTISCHTNRKCHQKNSLLYVARHPTSVLDQIQGCTSAESWRKRVQFVTLFHILFADRPMHKFCARLELYKFLVVSDLAQMH